MDQPSKTYESFANHVRSAADPWLMWDEASGSEIKLCKLNPSTGEILCFIRVPPGQTLAKHFHPGTVVVYTVQGCWTYGEGWTAEPGDVIFENAGSTHAPTTVGDTPTIIFAVVQGSFEFVDDAGQRIGYDNWQTLHQKYDDHCANHGLRRRDLTQ